ncbi:BtrH N-terminal domain-containing protein [Amycolatopsis anabasis]|uniref:BtrH N-terminal domain-containing protein n=1 Tax=Amycolatopsis anabasis TaxID=1840409 RepID=UPI00131D4A7E|nr:BtrH N-terminal domain-containing protein [Amycolatopsis anabasis]
MLVEGVSAHGTEHCETSALGVLLRHEGLDLSEPMLFGLGSGLAFLYWDAKSMDFPFLGGRVKPFELTRNLADRLGLRLDVRETTSPRRAWQTVVEPIGAGRPVGLQLDSYHLEYFTSKIHFGGHIVALYGYDDERAHLVDTRQQGGAVTTSLASLAAARSERGPMTAKNRSFTIRVPDALPPLRDLVVPAIRACAENFLDPPIANLGHRGIDKASKLVRTWLDRAEDPRRDLPLAATLMERAGTGGALFRNLYRDFLGECTRLIDDRGLHSGQQRYAEAAALWSEVAGLITAAGETGDAHHLERASAVLADLARLERDAMRTLAALRP